MPDLDRVSVVLVRPRQPGNIGAVARGMLNHGLHHLILVDPPAFDPDRARWMAPNATQVIDQARFVSTVDQAIADAQVVIATSARKRRWSWPTWTPDELTSALDTHWAGASVALLFGPEDMGLSNEDLARCTAIVSLPTAEHSSLNLGQAVTVLAHRLYAAGAHAPPEPSEPPPPVQLQARAVDRALDLLEDTDYFAGRSREQVAGTLYRLLNRAQARPDEISALLGMAAALRYRLDHPD